MSASRTPVALVGAGPIGIEMAVTLKRAGIEYLHFEKRQIAHTMSWFPPMMRFFSSPDRIAIAGVPIPRVDESKCSREEYMAYLRSVVLSHGLEIRSYEEVLSVEPLADGGFRLHTRSARGEQELEAGRVILAIGDMHRPRMVDVPGEDLPHVTHYFGEPHEYFQRKVLVVGGKNSAVEAALRCFHCGSQVSILHREQHYDAQSVKYWLLPELLGRIERGEITDYAKCALREIRPTSAVLTRLGQGESFEVEADFVLLMTGYRAELGLLRGAGVTLEGPEEQPVFDAATMQTDVPGLYIAGTVTGGSQQSYRVFIENCHIHCQRILAHLRGEAPPAESEGKSLEEALPES